MSGPRLANWQIVAVALWSLGGATERKDTEDVAVKCWELAPGRFSWERYSEFPNLDTARVALSDAKKPKNGSLVTGDNYGGWLLTQAGLDWIESRATELVGIASGRGGSAIAGDDANALISLEEKTVFQAWLGADTEGIELYQLADALSLPADAPRRVVVKRAEELKNAAHVAGHKKAEEFVSWLLRSIAKEN